MVLIEVFVEMRLEVAGRRSRDVIEEDDWLVQL